MITLLDDALRAHTGAHLCAVPYLEETDTGLVEKRGAATVKLFGYDLDGNLRPCPVVTELARLSAAHVIELARQHADATAPHILTLFDPEFANSPFIHELGFLVADVDTRALALLARGLEIVRLQRHEGAR